MLHWKMTAATILSDLFALADTWQVSKVQVVHWLDTTCGRLGSWPQIRLILPHIQSNWPLSWLAILGWADGPVAQGRYFRHQQWQILALSPGSSEVFSFSWVFWFTLIKWWLLSVQGVQRCAAHISCSWIEIDGLRLKLILCKVQEKRFGQVD